MTLVIGGHPHIAGIKLYNAGSVICDGKIVATYLKNLFPTIPYSMNGVISNPASDLHIRTGWGQVWHNICQDVWQKGSVTRAKEAGADVLLVLNASPIHEQTGLALSTGYGSASAKRHYRWFMPIW